MKLLITFLYVEKDKIINNFVVLKDMIEENMYLLIVTLEGF